MTRTFYVRNYRVSIDTTQRVLRVSNGGPSLSFFGEEALWAILTILLELAVNHHDDLRHISRP